MNVDILPAGTCQSATLENRTSLHITWAPILYAGVPSNDHLGTECIRKPYGMICNTSAAKNKTVRRETYECVCDMAAILSDQQEAVGQMMGRWEQGTGLAFSLSLSLSVLVASGHKG